MDQPSLPLQISPIVRRRGRPRGSGNKRSVDLARYVEATFGGMTPGQQSARLCLVTPKELKAAGDLTAAMVAKARELALALGCQPAEAWVLLAKERMELMAYVHQKRPAAAPEKPADQLPTAFLIPAGPTGEALPQAVPGNEDLLEILGEFRDDAG